MKLLLHTCCAPCAIYPVKIAKEEGFEVTGFFYNPNIHPLSEYVRRIKEAKKYFQREKLKLISAKRNVADFFANIKENVPKRCFACWDMRLGKTVEVAKREGFDAFTTTLLASPYQDHAAVKEICERLFKKNGIKFYYRDFRMGFKEAHRYARKRGMYCQNYCGCVFSLVERGKSRK